ncbi:hypothetical protein [Paracoccus sediminilitoris]|nr:hypothetical protein [Paracoccus sediminilitoris]
MSMKRVYTSLRPQGVEATALVPDWASSFLLTIPHGLFDKHWIRI